MAIAYDATSEGYANTGTTATFSHTTSGSDRVLLVGGWTNSTTATVSSVTYNGTNLTRIGNVIVVQSNVKLHLFGMVAPSTGANNIVATVSANIYHTWTSTSYTGVSQSAVPSNYAEGNTTAVTSYSRTVTTVSDQNWVAGTYVIVGGTNRAGSAGTVIRQEDWQAQLYMVDEGPNSSGDVTTTVTWTSTDNPGAIIVELAPVAAASGPTNLKSLDTNLKANIKSFNTNVIANIKSINTNT